AAILRRLGLPALGEPLLALLVGDRHCSREDLAVGGCLVDVGDGLADVEDGSRLRPEDEVFAGELLDDVRLGGVLLHRGRVEGEAEPCRDGGEDDAHGPGDRLLLAVHVLVCEDQDDERDEGEDRDDQPELV
ncbi:hypothetical protein ABE10_01300, partial [Bacillus toyonensis]|nr:hypothetical protein [Bacillus toyonensis]